MAAPRKLVVGLSVAATIFALAAAFLTANGWLYLLAALAAAGSIFVWRAGRAA